MVQDTGGTATLVIDDSGDPNAYPNAVVDPNGLLSGVAPADITWSVGPALLYFGGM